MFGNAVLFKMMAVSFLWDTVPVQIIAVNNRNLFQS